MSKAVTDTADALEFAGGDQIQLANLGQLLESFRIKKKLDLTGVYPIGTMDQAGIFHLGAFGQYANSVPDNQGYDMTMDHARRLRVSGFEPWWSNNPAGRVLHMDDFENSIVSNYAEAGSPAAGTLAIGATKGHSGIHNLTVASRAAGAAAGDLGTARKPMLRAADQGFNRNPTVFAAVFFNPNASAAWRSVWLRVNLRDAAREFNASVRYHRRQGGADSFALEYLDSAGTYQSTGITYPMDDTDLWHLLVVELAYKQQPGPYLNYVSARIDDAIWEPTARPAAQNVGAATINWTAVDMTVETDAAATATMLFDDFMVADLSRLGGLNQ